MPELLKLSDLMRVLGVSRSTVRRLLAAGALPPPVKLHSVKRWKLSDLQRVLDAA